MLAALACIVLFVTTYMLIIPAITMEQTAYCGSEAHIHDDNCFEKQLVCEIEEANEHVHSDTCYIEEQVLICDEECIEHVHDESCISCEQVLSCSGEHDYVDFEFEEENIATDSNCLQVQEHNDACYQNIESYICGLLDGENSHTHGSECYEIQSVFACVQEEGEEKHVHTDACYEETKICTLEEHEHTLPCFSNPEADVETKTVWERTISDVEPTGVWADDVISIAESQIGYEESAKNYEVTEDDVKKGYTRYGAWYGDAYGDWCAMFVSFCLNYAEVTDYPIDANCQSWVETLSAKPYQSYFSRDSYEPQPGDLVFFNTDGKEGADHVGIFYENIEETDTKIANICTIEGNASDCVKYVTYDANDPTIQGYGKLPKNPKLENSEDEKFKLTTIIAEKCQLELSGQRSSLPFSPEEITITAEAVVNENATALVDEAVMGMELDEVDIYLFDIRLWHDGNEIELLGPVSVSINGMASKEEIRTTKVFHVDEENSQLTDMKAEVMQEGEIVFITDHFSIYGLVIEKQDDMVLNEEMPIMKASQFESQEPEIRKWVDKLDEDDNYDLNLSITGVDVEINDKKDILFIVDTTGSMMYSMDGYYFYGNERWSNIRSSIEHLTTLMEDSASDVRYSMLMFSSDGVYGEPYGAAYGDAGYIVDWTENGEEIVNTLNEKTPYLGGGTNYEAPFYYLNQNPTILGNARSDATKYVVFITDGEPNSYYDSYGRTVPDDSYGFNKSLSKAKAQVAQLKGIDEFFAIGVGTDAGLDVLNDIANSVDATSAAYSCRKTGELEQRLIEIFQGTGSVSGKVIEDKLSEMAQVTQEAMLTITVTDIHGEKQTETGTLVDGIRLKLAPTNRNPNGTTMILTYDDSDKRLELYADSGYQIENGWEYKISTQIEPTELAYTTYEDSGTYPHIGESNTGITSDEQQGYKSNVDGQALFYFTWGGENQTKEFPRPVIQLQNQNYVPSVPEGTVTREPEIRKWVEKLDVDDNYDLNLSVTGADVKINDKKDILFIVDTTGSMMYSMDGYYRYGNERWNNIRSSIENLTMLMRNSSADVRYSMIMFSSDGVYGEHYGAAYGDAGYIVDWTENGDKIVNTLNEKTPYLGGGTNYEAPFYLLNQKPTILGNARSDATKYVVFITDGEPNTYYGNYGTSLDDNPTGNQNALPKAKVQVAQLKGMDELYAIGVGTDAGLDTLKDLISSSSVKHNAYSCRETGELEERLVDIFQGGGLVSGTLIEDELSEMAQVTENAMLTITVTNKQGEQQVATGNLVDGARLKLAPTDRNPKGTMLTLTYSDSNKYLKLSSDSEYQIEYGWEYKITTQIEPTELAYTTYESLGTYPHIGESNTGITSDGQLGYKSNVDGKALFHFTYGGEYQRKEFPRPVIQVENQSLPTTEIPIKLFKTDPNGTPLSGAEFSLESFEGIDWSLVADKVCVDAQGNAALSGLYCDILYRLTETSAPAGYYVLTSPVYFKLLAVDDEVKLVPFDESGTQISDWPSQVKLVADDTIGLQIINQQGMILPETGGVGVERIYLLGLCFVFIPVISAGAIWRKNRKGGI